MNCIYQLELERAIFGSEAEGHSCPSQALELKGLARAARRTGELGEASFESDGRC